MRALVTRLRPDGTREKVLVTDWPEPEGPTGKQIKTQTIYSGITNGTEYNDLVGGNYAYPDDALPAGWGWLSARGACDRNWPQCRGTERRRPVVHQRRPHGICGSA